MTGPARKRNRSRELGFSATLPGAALGLFNPRIAAGAMAFSNVTAIGDSLRIKRNLMDELGRRTRFTFAARGEWLFAP
jgi:hypothetical protein